MKYIYLLAIISVMCFSCQKQDFIDTGKANGKHDCSILEYMKTDGYNWDTTILVIERAGLTELFEGNDPDNPQITFIGCTNHSIRRWMFNDGYNYTTWVYKPSYFKVSEIPVEDCKNFILRHVIKGRYMKSDIPKGISFPKEGGQDFSTLGDNELWLYTRTSPWGGIPDAGPTHLYVESYTEESKVDVASSDIECLNGVVHSLHYNYTFGDI